MVSLRGEREGGKREERGLHRMPSIPIEASKPRLVEKSQCAEVEEREREGDNREEERGRMGLVNDNTAVLRRFC